VKIRFHHQEKAFGVSGKNVDGSLGGCIEIEFAVELDSSVSCCFEDARCFLVLLDRKFLFF
jgi:hypothetical protein